MKFTEKEILESVLEKLKGPDAHSIEYFYIGKLWVSAYFTKSNNKFITLSIKHQRDSFLDKTYIIPVNENDSSDLSDILDEVSTISDLTKEINRLHKKKTIASIEGF